MNHASFNPPLLRLIEFHDIVDMVKNPCVAASFITA